MTSSFDEVFEVEFDALYRYLARRLDSSTADELAAETFAIAYRRWAHFDSARAARPWLYGIAANLVQHHWRKERRMLRAYERARTDSALPEDEASAERLDAQRAQASLAAALAELRPSEREVLLLRAWAELTDSEIAEALSLPLGTVKSRLSRARDHMRNRLGAFGKVEADSQNTFEETRR